MTAVAVGTYESERWPGSAAREPGEAASVGSKYAEPTLPGGVSQRTYHVVEDAVLNRGDVDPFLNLELGGRVEQ